MTSDEIQKDREAGTPGPWIASMYDPENEGGEYDTVLADAGFHGVSGLAYITHFWAGHAADCRRIARLPDLEEAYLALTAENAALKERVAKLETALHPFSKTAGEMFSRNWEKDDVALKFVTKGKAFIVTFSDFLNAHAAMATPIPEDE